MNNRVRISYTVDMDEVPVRIAMLLREAQEKCGTVLSNMGQVVTALEEETNIERAWNSIDSVRQDMMKMDLRLEDCQELLASYQAALAQIKAPPQEPSPEPAEEVGDA